MQKLVVRTIIHDIHQRRRDGCYGSEVGSFFLMVGEGGTLSTRLEVEANLTGID